MRALIPPESDLAWKILALGANVIEARGTPLRRVVAEKQNAQVKGIAESLDVRLVAPVVVPSPTVNLRQLVPEMPETFAALGHKDDDIFPSSATLRHGNLESHASVTVRFWLERSDGVSLGKIGEAAVFQEPEWTPWAPRILKSTGPRLHDF